MRIRGLGAFLAILLTTACASVQRVPVPHWGRYDQGELSGFLRAPGEQLVRRVPELIVQRARGRIALPTAEGRRELPLQSWPTTRGEAVSAPYRPPEYAVIDTRMFVVELRGPSPDTTVRTVALRGGSFDFGSVPNGRYELKTTASGSAFALGWQSEIRTVIVSDSADPGAEIRIP